MWPSLKPKGHRGEIFFLKLCFSFNVVHFHGMMRADPVVAGEDNV